MAKVSEGASLVTLRTQLEDLQGKLADVRRKKARLDNTEVERLNKLLNERNDLLDQLQQVRSDRRQERRDQVDELNSKMAGMVKLDVPAAPDHTQFREALSALKVGSRVREDVLDAIASTVHPFSLGRSMLAESIDDLVDENEGIDAASIGRLMANLDDRELWSEMLEAQVCPMPDKLHIKFKKPDDGQYTSIENLAHGQRCTAVLVVLLADGTSPVVVDQPEDALHAPWIEEYLVDRLRSLRGVRQYIFATRSPGIVVGADAEQLITMKATSGRGQVEASGSLERHDLNELALHHLEGGPVPYRRRSSKLNVSVHD